MEENVENCGYFVTQEQHERIIKEVPKYVKPLVECYGKIGEILQSIEEKEIKELNQKPLGGGVIKIMYYTESELKQWRKDLPERIQKRIKEIWAKEENANNPTVTINGATIEIVPNNFSYTIGIEVNECIIKNTPSIKKNNNE